MLHVLDPQSPISETSLTRSGGFAWWYVDAVDEHGNGFVCIWSWGLPFLPGYAGSVRRGNDVPAASRPSFNLAIYEQGRPALYLLQEHAPDAARRDQTEWCFGDTRITRAGNALHLAISAPIPGSPDRLVGTIRVSGAEWTRRVGGPAPQERSHGWCPQLGPCNASVDLVHGADRFSYNGPAYADRNEGDQPLHALGIDRWVWGRATWPDETRIAYVLWPEGGGAPTPYAIRILSNGDAIVSEATVETGRNAFSPWGEATPSSLTLTVDGEHFLTLATQHPVDNSPFYARSLGRGTCALGERPAMIESCTPRRIDPGWFRPLLSMATHRVGGRNSMWLPLFVGPQRTRWPRLFASWRGIA